MNMAFGGLDYALLGFRC